MAVLLVSVGLYGSNMNQIYAQNNALSQSGNSEAEQAIEQAQSSSQDAQCVSGDITALSCNNLGLQLQRNGDDDNGKEPPVPPGEKGCPEDTVWDVTVREDPETDERGVPNGTVVCLTEDRPGNQDAYIIDENGQPIPTQANPNQPTPNEPNCQGNNQQLAQVTSGVPPQPAEMGDLLCIQVDVPAEV